MAPLFSLLALSPLIAEYLLGNLTFSQMVVFPLMMIFYGGGAVVIREVTVRARRGWPTVILLGLAYGIVEEGLATQSLFNPNYLGAHLLDFGFIPSLGIAPPWTVYVLSLHTVWSITVPIALVGILFPARRDTPWVGTLGLGVVSFVFVAGTVLVTVITRRMQHNFFASPAQLGISVLIAAVIVAAAFLLFPAKDDPVDAAPVPAGTEGWLPWILGLVTFVCGSEFHIVNYRFHSLTPPEIVAIQFVPMAIVLAVVAAARRSAHWTRACADGVAVGALLVYGWWGFRLSYEMHGAASIPGQCFPAGVILALLALAHFRSASWRHA
jgi:hypothetical protein